MPTPKTVIICGRDDVLSRSVELFLATAQDWRVVTVRDVHCPEGLIAAAQALNPKVIVINEGDASLSTGEVGGLPMLLIQKFPGVKVITLSLGNNCMEVFSKEQVTISEVDDLLSAVVDHVKTGAGPGA